MSNNFYYRLPLKDEVFKKDNLQKLLVEWAKYTEDGQKVEYLTTNSFEEDLALIGNAAFVRDAKNWDDGVTYFSVDASEIPMMAKEGTKIDYMYRLHIVLKGFDFIDTGYINCEEKIVYQCIEQRDTCEEADELFPYPDFTIFMLKTHKDLIDRNGPFRYSSSIITLRGDDAEGVAKVLNGETEIYKPYIFIRTDNEEIEESVCNMFGIRCTTLLDDEPEFYEELPKYLLDEELMPLEEHITLISNDDCREFAVEDYADNPSNLLFMLLCSLQGMAGCCDYVDEFSDYASAMHKKCVNYTNTLMRMLHDHTNTIKSLKQDKIELQAQAKVPVEIAAGSPLVSQPQMKYVSSELLTPGDEKDLYSGEIKDMVITSLQEYRKKYVPDGSRRADVLDDILAKNKSKGIIKKKEDEIRDVLKDFTGDSHKLIKDLEKIGFKVKSKNGHIKVEWQADSRYVHTIASTPSDNVCAGENLIHQMVNKYL